MKTDSIYKGVVVQVTPKKGFGFIKPSWARPEDGSRENIFMLFSDPSEKRAHRCFIDMLDPKKPELHTETKNGKGEALFFPAGDPQVIYFKVCLQEKTDKFGHTTYPMIAYDLVDVRHITEEELARVSDEKPDFDDEDAIIVNYSDIEMMRNVILMQPLVEEAAVEEAPVLPPVEAEAEQEVEEEAIEEFDECDGYEEDDDYEEYEFDAYGFEEDRKAAKRASKRIKSCKNNKEERWN